jgi:ketosteroid isomerase-like protein
MTANAATVEALLDLFPRDDAVAALRDPEALRLRFQPLADRVWPDFEVAMIGPTSAARIDNRGIDGLIEAWSDWVSPFSSHRTEVEGIEEAGDSVLVLIRQVATPTGASSPVDNSGAAVLRFRGGKMAKIEFHLSREVARRSAGLED